MSRENSKISVIVSVLVVAVLITTLMPMNVDAAEVTGTQGGVPGNRQYLNAMTGADTSNIGTVTDASDGTTGDHVNGNTYQAAFEKAVATDVTSGVAATPNQITLLQNPGTKQYMIVSTNSIDTFGFGDTLTATVDKWRTDTTGGYFTSQSWVANGGPPNFPAAATLQKIPDVSINPISGTSTTISWNGLSTAANMGDVIGFMVYRATGSNDTANGGWGSTFTEWVPLAANAQTAINNSHGGYSMTYTGAESVYIPNGGPGQVHSVTDGTMGGNCYYAVTAIIEGASGAWNIESMYRGRGSAQFSYGVAVGPIPDVDFRSTDGIQILQMPTDLQGITTANALAVAIEAGTTGLDVLYISDYDNGWKDYLHRDSSGTALPAFQTLTDFTLDTDESYVISVLSSGATSWDSPWMEDNSPNTISMDAGWNNVGVFSSTAYDVPTDVTDHASIDGAAAWDGNAWAVPGGSWADVQAQSAGGLSQTFTANGNVHGFFVRAPSSFVWGQSS